MSRRAAPLAVVLIGAAAAVVLIVVGVNLLSDINGPECHGEFPVCTTPTQHSVRQTFAIWCGVCVLFFLVASRPALSARRIGWPHLLIGVVIVVAVVALAADPVSHIQSEAGSDQWFVNSWPL